MHADLLVGSVAHRSVVHRATWVFPLREPASGACPTAEGGHDVDDRPGASRRFRQSGRHR